MLIRPMTMNDYDAVYQLWIITPGMGLNDIDDSYQGIERMLTRNPTLSFVAENEHKEIIGVIIAGAVIFTTRRYCRNIVTKKSVRHW